MSSTYAIDDTITRPGTVSINVEGAFIVDEGNVTPDVVERDGSVHDSRDIRLPHHTAVVSHVAVDVRQVPKKTLVPSLQNTERTMDRLVAL